MCGLPNVAYITGIDQASVENLKSFCASVATYGGAALFHMRGVTPEADRFTAPDDSIVITQADLDEAQRSLVSAQTDEADFVSLGCPHLTLNEIARIAEEHDLLIISDEIYDRLVYGLPHVCVPALDESIKRRTVLLGGFPKD